MNKLLMAQIFGDLIEQAGGFDAATAAIEARCGSISQGTLTKIQKGQLEVPLRWAWALEDAAKNMPFTRNRNRRLESTGQLTSDRVCHLVTLKESTEAVTAQAAAENSDDPEVLRRALKETLDVRAKCDADVACYQAKLAALGVEVGD
ncbi:hypothetical protein ACR03S_10245 [Limimaricola variabilis]|uniref:hypothetical protein n=1 Tax=Limimaricola variabilis TaxID=1492771 RepID=UPI002AC9DFF7|nr:hypothetical protein [Limimaricola variabilis]WPY95623.1 hypothetical protein T8T21_05740 [Limimaricola variabilis]